MLIIIRMVTMLVIFGWGWSLKAVWPVLDFRDPSSQDYYYYGFVWHQPTSIPYIYGPGYQIQMGMDPTSKQIDWFPMKQADSNDASLCLDEFAGYNNARQYLKALIKSNAARIALTTQNIASSTKASGPLTGKSLASLSFWDWIKAGEMSLQVYGRIRAMMSALESGTVTVNAWKMMPKLSVLCENDPNQPALFLGLQPSSEGVMGLIQDIVDWSDPRYRFSSKANFSNIKGLVPTLSVKPSFYGALAHYQNGDMTNQWAMARMSRNMHEVMNSLSMLKREVAGGAPDPAKRYNTVNAKETVELLRARDDSWRDLGIELTRNIRGTPLSAEAAQANSALVTQLNQLGSLRDRNLMDMVSRQSANTFAARALATEMDNVTFPLESEDYMQMIDQIESLVELGASSKGTPTTQDSMLARLRTASADAGVNRLIRDELRAVRQLIGMRARRELVDRMAPSIALGLKNLDEGTSRLTALERQVANLQRHQAGARQVLTAGQMSKILEESIIVDW